MIEPGHSHISLRQQCELIGLHRSSWYYQPAGESAFNLQLMRLIDEQYLRTPFYGSPKMTAWLRRQGHPVNPKRIARLMRLMGLQAIYPKPKTSIPGKDHRIYPYLLRNLEIVHPNQVWCSDITYVPMARGFMYLVAVMDWYSRFVLTIRTMFPKAPFASRLRRVRRNPEDNIDIFFADFNTFNHSAYQLLFGVPISGSQAIPYFVGEFFQAGDDEV